MGFDLDLGKVAGDMLNAALPHLIKGGDKAAKFATHELSQYAKNVQNIYALALAHEIDQEESQFLLRQYRMSLEAVLLTIEGLGVIAVQKAINAAIDVLNEALEKAIGAALGGLGLTL